ncbi:MAG: GNAT family N-acetyltransferase [Burkholderiaceae bacterium]|nr:GNAT family N-acetyltransferase [Burkholderiaceae bacterium]
MYKFLAPLQQPLGQITVRSESPVSADAAALMNELSATLALITGDSGRASFDVADVQGDKACFAIARDRMGMAVGCGSIRPLQEGVAEIKRMLARPGHAGVGRAVLAYLEDEARRLGYSELWLETRQVNVRAVRFYEKHGYRRRENFGKYIGNAQAVCFEKTL